MTHHHKTDLRTLLNANKAGEAVGIYAICSAHPLVIEAAMLQARQDGSPLLIEATANQVNQFGGYTGMKPADFIRFVHDIAARMDFPPQQIIFGGDHLGPVCWKQLPAETAMARANELIEAFVAAGFSKIHLDASMACADDVQPLDDRIIAARAAQMCATAEATARLHFGKRELLYVIGTEVPAPGGVSQLEDHLAVTSIAHVDQTLHLHREAFAAQGLGEEVWQRVVGLVVQPGVEFSNDRIHHFDVSKTGELSRHLRSIPHLVYEAHSTDYQRDTAYGALVRGHFAILKVGPQLTFALREALFVLSYIEDELLPSGQRSQLRSICEQRMRERPDQWRNFYTGDETQNALDRRYSYSDRIRYYWTDPQVDAAVQALFANLEQRDIPLPLISQFLPQQYEAVINEQLPAQARDLVRHRIMQVTRKYARACLPPSSRPDTH